MSTDPAAPRLRELGTRYRLADAQIGQLATFLAELDRDPHAPSAITDPARAVDAHVADSLTALDVGRLPERGEIVDIGSGAGVPGLVLAVALPAARLTLVESHARTCEFLAAMCRRMGLANVEIVCSRVEEWHAGAGRADAAVVRAISAQPTVLEYAAPLLRVGGVVVDWRGPRDPVEEVAAARAAEELGLGPAEVLAVEPFPGASDHNLHIFVKLAETPERFPRRPGAARKRPIGS